MARKGKFLRVTATLEVDDGSKITFLTANGETSEVEAERAELAVGIEMLRHAVELYFKELKTPKF